MEDYEPDFYERLDRLEKLRKDSNYELDKLSEAEQEENIALDYLAILLYEFYLEQEAKKKEKPD
jgi:hypothetical protein